MTLKDILKSDFYPEYIQLTAEEKAYLVERPFKTETCAECSKFYWANSKDGETLIRDNEGEIPSCSTHDKELDVNPGTEDLTPEQALNYHFGNNKGICENYDGPKMYTEIQIREFIEKRDEIIKKIAGEEFLEEYKKDIRV